WTQVVGDREGRRRGRLCVGRPHARRQDQDQRERTRGRTTHLADEGCRAHREPPLEKPRAPERPREVIARSPCPAPGQQPRTASRVPGLYQPRRVKAQAMWWGVHAVSAAPRRQPCPARWARVKYW